MLIIDVELTKLFYFEENNYGVKLFKSLIIFFICISCLCLKSTSLASELTQKLTDTNEISFNSSTDTSPKENQLSEQKETDEDPLPFIEKEKKTQELNSFGLLLRTVGALILILGLLILVVWVMRQMSSYRSGASDTKTSLVILSTLSIGDKQSVTAIRFGNRILLLGATNNSINILASEDCPKEENSDSEQISPTNTNNQKVSQLIEKLDK